MPAPGGFLEGPNDGAYFYNAGRDPWRIATDALLNGDATSRQQAQKIAAWAKTKTGGAPASLKAGYQLNGTELNGSDYFTTFFAAPIGVAAMTLPASEQAKTTAARVLPRSPATYRTMRPPTSAATGKDSR